MMVYFLLEVILDHIRSGDHIRSWYCLLQHRYACACTVRSEGESIIVTPIARGFYNSTKLKPFVSQSSLLTLGFPGHACAIPTFDGLINS